MVLALMLESCGGGGGSDGGAGGKLVVAASIHPLADLAQQVLGDDAKVVTLLPPGASPHGYEIKAGRMVELAQADVLLVADDEIDSWAVRAAKTANPKIKVWAMAEVVENHQSEGGTRKVGDQTPPPARAPMSHPPPAISPRLPIHPWLSPTLVTRYVTALGDRFAALDQTRAASITANAQALRGRIQRVIDQYKPRLAKAPRKKLVTFHDAFDALAHDMGLTVIAHLVPPSPTPGSEPTANRLTQAIEKIRERHLAVVYSEPQFPAHTVEAIRAETGATVLSLDPLGRAGEHYQDLLRRNLQTLVKGQDKRK